MRKFLSLVVLLVMAITATAKDVIVYVKAEGFQPYVYAWVSGTNPEVRPFGDWKGKLLTKQVSLTDKDGVTSTYYMATASYEGDQPISFVIHDGNGNETKNILNQPAYAHYYTVRYDSSYEKGMHYDEDTNKFNTANLSTMDVNIIGGFNSWTKPGVPLTKIGENTYTYTFTGNTVFKLLINGETWVGAESMHLIGDQLSDAGGINHDVKFTGEEGQTYTVTLKWNPNASAENGWTIEVTPVNPTDVVITSALHATYAFSGYTNYADERTGLQAYTVTVENGVAKLHEINGVVPPFTPVVLKGAEAKTYKVYPYSAQETADVSVNDLKLSHGDVYGDGSTIYALGNKSKGVGFYLATKDNVVPDGRCYLLINKESGAKDFISFDDETTGINNFKAETVESSAIYNLQGIQVDENYEGIVIKNGKKYINK